MFYITLVCHGLNRNLISTIRNVCLIIDSTKTSWNVSHYSRCLKRAFLKQRLFPETQKFWAISWYDGKLMITAARTYVCVTVRCLGRGLEAKEQFETQLYVSVRRNSNAPTEEFSSFNPLLIELAKLFI